MLVSEIWPHGDPLYSRKRSRSAEYNVYDQEKHIYTLQMYTCFLLMVQKSKHMTFSVHLHILQSLQGYLRDFDIRFPT